jgi:hypothetical protein
MKHLLSQFYLFYCYFLSLRIKGSSWHPDLKLPPVHVPPFLRARNQVRRYIIHQPKLVRFGIVSLHLYIGGKKNYDLY